MGGGGGALITGVVDRAANCRRGASNSNNGVLGDEGADSTTAEGGITTEELCCTRSITTGSVGGGDRSATVFSGQQVRAPSIKIAKLTGRDGNRNSMMWDDYGGGYGCKFDHGCVRRDQACE
jgi:hypothetical protein